MFKEDDLRKCKAVRKLIDEGDFLLKGRSVPPFVLCMSWLKELQDKIEEEIEKDLKSKPTKKKVK